MIDQKELARRNGRIMLIAVAVVIVMVGICFASVPLYRVFCQVTGLAGTTQRAENNINQIPANARRITIRFNADTDAGLPWDFKPDEPTTTIKIGETGRANFTARNLASQPTRGVAVYNISPFKAGKYFTKTQCFCFSDQSLAPRATAHLPVVFYVDPKMQSDPNMNDIQEITLSYRFYPAGSKNLDRATKKIENAPSE